jgi:hypothetical protein
MELVLHIGTHKTGTSALQRCLLQNEQILADKGIHYARMKRSKHSNGLARLVAKKDLVEAKAFVDRQVDKAKSIGAKTLIITAESFYAMTMFFHKYHGRQRHDYWTSESDAIERLRDMLPWEVSTRLIVFFRRQDRFLESIYRQVVKTQSVAMPIDEFRIFMSEPLDYWRHMEIWNAVFPNCAVYTYEQASDSISAFFLRNVLDLANVEEFEGLDSRRNVRWNRDVLEYKRMLNGMDMSAVDRRMSQLACKELARSLPDDSQYQDYLSPAAREMLLREMEPGNALLSETFGMTPFPVSDEGLKAWTPYPGISDVKAKELANRHARIRRSADYRIERWALLVRQLIQRQLPALGWIIPLVRSLLPHHRHALSTRRIR